MEMRRRVMRSSSLPSQASLIEDAIDDFGRIGVPSALLPRPISLILLLVIPCFLLLPDRTPLWPVSATPFTSSAIALNLHFDARGGEIEVIQIGAPIEVDAPAVSNADRFRFVIPDHLGELQVDVDLVSPVGEATLCQFRTYGRGGEIELSANDLCPTERWSLAVPEARLQVTAGSWRGSCPLDIDRSLWIPNSGSVADGVTTPLERVRRLLIAGRNADADEQLSAVEKELSLGEDVAEAVRLSGVIQQRFSEVDPLHARAAKRLQERAELLVPAGSETRARLLIDSARRLVEKLSSEVDPETFRRDSRRAITLAREAVDLTARAGNDRLGGFALAVAARAAALCGYRGETVALARSAAEAYPSPDVLWRCELAVGEIAERELRQNDALAAYKEAVAHVESMRAVAASSDSLLLTGRLEPYRKLVALEARLGLAIESLHHAESARASRTGTLPTFESIRSLPDRIDKNSLVVSAFDCGVLLVCWAIEDSIQVSVFESSSEEISRQVELLRSSRGEDLGAAVWLGERILVGAAESVRSSILLAPHGDLRRIPFPVLQVGGTPLVDRFTSALLTDCLSASRPRPVPDESTWIAFVDPDTDYDGDGIPDLSPLPGARREGREILATTHSSRLWAGKAATESRLSHLPGDTSMIHLGCHGTFFPHRPLRSQLYLAADEGGDGRLQARELAELSLDNCRLLVLSGCETALAASWGADDLAGFPRAALDAGVGAVMGSLWKVGDRATERFMRAFYSRLSESEDLPSAVRAARIACRSAPGASGAGNWSSWVLVENGWEWADNVELDG